jgi:hypothetical protein
MLLYEKIADDVAYMNDLIFNQGAFAGDFLLVIILFLHFWGRQFL